MEIEIRAKISDLSFLQKQLNGLSGVIIKKQAGREVDTYLKHSKDGDGLLIFRIRRKENGSLFTLKTKSTATKDVAWKDIDLPLEDPNRLEDILMNSGYEYVILIDKVRDSFQYNEYEINIDNIRDLGHFIEIEAQSAEININEKILEMKKIFNHLGIADKDIIERGYVQLMKEKR